MGIPADRRPTWLTEPCPAWCTRVHHEDDHPEDRVHQDDGTLVPSLLARVDDETLRRIPTSGVLLVQCTQRLDEPTPWVIVTEPEDTRRAITLSPESARLVAAVLNKPGAG